MDEDPTPRFRSQNKIPVIISPPVQRPQVHLVQQLSPVYLYAPDMNGTVRTHGPIYINPYGAVPPPMNPPFPPEASFRNQQPYLERIPTDEFLRNANFPNTVPQPPPMFPPINPNNNIRQPGPQPGPSPAQKKKKRIIIRKFYRSPSPSPPSSPENPPTVSYRQPQYYQAPPPPKSQHRFSPSRSPVPIVQSPPQQQQQQQQQQQIPQPRSTFATYNIRPAEVVSPQMKKENQQPLFTKINSPTLPILEQPKSKQRLIPNSQSTQIKTKSVPGYYTYYIDVI